MPTVPIYNRQVKTAALPDVKVIDRVPDGAFGSGFDTEAVDRALKGTASAIAEVYMNEQQRADEVAVTSAKKKLTELELDLQFNPEYGYLNRKGKAAGEAIPDVQTRWQKGSASILDGLSSDRQKAVFDKEIGSRWDSLGRHLNQHAFTEARQYDKDETDAYIENERNAAVANYSNPERVLRAIEEQKQSVYEFGKRNGSSDEEIKATLQAEASKTHAMILEQYINADQDLAAKSYFEKFGDQFVGKDTIRAKELVEASSLRGESQRNADFLVGKHATEVDALAEANKIQEPKLRDETVKRVKELHATRRTMRQQAGEDLYNSLDLQIEQKKITYDAIPETKLSLLTPAQRAGLNKKSNGEDIKTDRTLFNDLYRMGTTPETRSSFAAKDLTQYANKLSFGDQKELLRLQGQARKGEREELDDLHYNRRQLDNALAEYGYLANKKSKGDMEEYNRATLAAEDDMRFLQKSLGRKRLTNDEVKSVVDNLMKQELPGTERSIIGFEYGRKTILDIEPGEKIPVPDVDRAKIIEALNKKGLPVSDARITAEYLKKLRIDRLKVK